MSKISVAVLDHSRLGHTEVIARCVDEGAGAGAVDGVTATLVPVAEARIAVAIRRWMAAKAG